MEAIDIKGDDEVLQLLRGAPIVAINTLVRHLTDEGTGRVMMPAAIKDLLSDSHAARHYSETTLRIIIQELQKFGGNSVANLARGSGVSYEQLVKDVAAHLEIPKDGSVSVERLELMACSSYLAGMWPSLDASECEKLRDVAGGAATSVSLSHLQEILLAGGTPAAAVAGYLAGRVYSPNHIADAPKKLIGVGGLKMFAGAIALGGAVVANAAAGEAFRVTVPCVAQIASLRQMRRELSGPEQGAPASAKTDESTYSLPPPLAVSHTESCFLQVADENGKALISVSHFPAELATRGADETALDAARISRLNPLLQAVPALMVGSDVGANHYLKVVVNGPLAAAADGHGLRGWVRGPDGRFVEQARFFEDDRLRSLANGAVLFQLASVVVAQKHLADISEKLDDIKNGVEAIAAFQENERRAGINGTLQYLQQVAPVLLSGELSTSVRDELETSERTLGTIQDHILTDIRALVDDVRTLKDPSNFGTRGLTRALHERQQQFEALSEQWRLCLSARLVACRLVCCFPGEAALVGQRQSALAKIAGIMLADGGLMEQFPSVLNARRDGLKAVTDSQVEVIANQERLRMWDLQCLPRVRDQAHATVEQAGALIEQSRQPAALVLQMRDGQVIQAFAVSGSI
ncbi:hypothetical protein QT383_18500 [Stenotrophomonas rhizophila]